MFDDGILKICKVENIARSGMKPVEGLELKSEHYFEFETIGLTRHYEAKRANTKISNVVKIWQDRNIVCEDVCILEDEQQYRCELVQHTFNEDGLPITRITLERLGEKYVAAENL